MFRVYREIERGEFFVVAGDCSQGGADKNFCQFFSTSKKDFPIVYSAHGVAAQMTDVIQPALEYVFDKTEITPVVAFERNNGGGSEMERLKVLNRSKKYEIYVMQKQGSTAEQKDTTLMGFNTTASSRPGLVSDWKYAWDNKLATIYDEETIKQHKTFIVNKQGKPEASSGKHDDAVISSAICWHLFQTVPIKKIYKQTQAPVHVPKDSVIGI